MRKINTSDVFKMARILNKMDIKNNIDEYFTIGNELKKDDNFNPTNFGVKIIFDLLATASDEQVENEIYSLLSGISEKETESIRNQSIETTVADIKQIISENNMTNFFNSASQLTQE